MVEPSKAVKNHFNNLRTRLDEESNWLAFTHTVRRLSIDLETWEDTSTNQRFWKATRPIGEDPHWVRMAFDFGEIARLPAGFVEREVHVMVERLFQDIVDLPWETYYDDVWLVEDRKEVYEEVMKRHFASLERLSPMTVTAWAKEEGEWRNV